MARHLMFVDSSLATRELGFRPGSIEAALARAARWYIANAYVAGGKCFPPDLGAVAHSAGAVHKL